MARGPQTPGWIWYVAYGANCSLHGLMRYLDSADPPAAARWVTIPHRRYFAGVSARWSGGVAFLELGARPEVQTTARAYLVSQGHFARIVRGENRADGRVDVPDVGGLDVGQWVRCGLPGSSDPTRNKYDAVLRLSDISGVPAITVSTSQTFARNPPSARYRAAMVAARVTYPPGARHST